MNLGLESVSFPLGSEPSVWILMPTIRLTRAA
jgi:hypothetical protein